MLGVQTLSLAPRNGKPFERWELMCMGLSHWLSRQVFEQLMLVTDSAGRELISELGFAYDVISNDLDKIALPPRVWSAGKFPAIQRASRMAPTFCHFDFDVFLFKKLPEWLTSAAIFAQCEESEEGRNVNRHLAYRVQELILPKAPWQWHRQQRLNSMRAVNMGIVGGTDWEFFSQYTDLAIRMLQEPENREVWERTEGDLSSLMVEQWWLVALAEAHGKEITTLLPDNEPEELSRALGYSHFLCWSKRNPYWAGRIERTFYNLFPHEHARLARIAKRNTLPVAKPYAL